MSYFTDLVKDEFAYLETEYNFICSVEDQYSVRYENENVILIFTYDSRLSYELYLYFDNKTSRENTAKQSYFTLGDLLELKGDMEFKELRTIQISDPDILKKFIKKISSAVQLYGQEVLTGKSDIFNELNKAVNIKIQKYNDKLELESVLSEASKVWAKKDYLKYYEILNPFKDKLPEAYRKKLIFASKRL